MGAPEHVEQLQAAVRALSAMGLTYADISEIENISRDTVCTWGKGSSRSHRAAPVTKVGRTARVVHRLTVTLADIGRAHARGGAARVRSGGCAPHPTGPSAWPSQPHRAGWSGRP